MLWYRKLEAFCETPDMKHVLTTAGTTGGIIAGIIAGLSAIAVAGCTDSSVLYRPVAFGQQPVIAAWNSGFSGKTALIEVHNAPADAAAQLAERASVPVGAAPVAGFTSVPGQASDPRYRVVLVFGTSDAFDGAAACALAGAGDGTVPASKQDPASHEVQAALCFNAERLSEIRLRPGAAPLGSGDELADRRLLGQIMDHLYTPQVGGRLRGDGCTLSGGC